jgi:hypothetical protein
MRSDGEKGHTNMDEKRSFGGKKINLEKEDNLQDLGANERIILRWILKNPDRSTWERALKSPGSG